MKKKLVIVLLLGLILISFSGCLSMIVPEENQVVYRAFLVGVGDYQYLTDLLSPPFDVARMHDILIHSSSGFSLINELFDLQATKSAILNGIANAFSGADENDISYFYYIGHGSSYEGVSYLCPTNSLLTSYDNDISVNELESALSAIPGTKVVILGCCHSGGFIGKGKGEIIISKEELKSFNDEIINVFSQADSKGLLTSNQYKVLTACLSSQVGSGIEPGEGEEVWPFGDEPFALFGGALCEGCGYDTYTHPYPADENENGEITLQEAYIYTDERVNDAAAELNYYFDFGIDQDTQVYPLNSDFVIIEE